MFCPRVQNRCHLCPKSGLNLAKRWLFTSAVQDTNVIVGLKLLTTGTNNGILCTGKEIKSGLKSARMETDDSNTYMQGSSFQEKILNIAISVLFFCKFLRNEDLSQHWACFTLKLGWLKTNAGTNIRPQNNMYLSALECPSG